MTRFTENRDKNITMRKSNAKLVDINLFRVVRDIKVGKSVKRVVAYGAEVLEMVRIKVVWVSGNEKWEKGCG